MCTGQYNFFVTIFIWFLQLKTLTWQTWMWIFTQETCTSGHIHVRELHLCGSIHYIKDTFILWIQATPIKCHFLMNFTVEEQTILRLNILQHQMLYISMKGSMIKTTNQKINLIEIIPFELVHYCLFSSTILIISALVAIKRLWITYHHY